MVQSHYGKQLSAHENVASWALGPLPVPQRRPALQPRRSAGSVAALTSTLAAHVVALGLALHGGGGQVDVPEQAGMRTQLRLINDVAAQPAVTLPSPVPAQTVKPPPRKRQASLPASTAPEPAPSNTATPLQVPAQVARTTPTHIAAPSGMEQEAASGEEPSVALSAHNRPGAASSTPVAAATSGVTEGEWAMDVMRRMEKFRVYPSAARSRRAQGVVLVQASIAADGRVLGARVRRSCGDADLDAEAVATFLRARRVPPPPAHLPAPLQVDVPVDFHLS